MVFTMFTNSLLPSLVLLWTICQCTAVQAAVGDSCTVASTNLTGTCRIASDCPKVAKQAMNGITPTFCGFYELTVMPIVCCENVNFALPNGNSSMVASSNLTNDFDVHPDKEEENPFIDKGPTLSKSEQKCQEYTKRVIEVVQAIPLVYDTEPVRINVVKCDYNGVSLVVGGEPALAAEFPFMAAIGYFVKNRTEYRCGGTLLSDFYVLTAAHCTLSKDSGDPKIVRLGDLDLSRSDDNSVHADYNISHIVVHPNYKLPQKYNDLALIRLSSKVRFTKYIRPACLHTSPDIGRDEVLATGWGIANRDAAELNNKLKKVTLHVYDNEVCSKVYHHKRFLPDGIKSSMLCAGEVKRGDTCQGDSGGPVFITKNGIQCKFYIVGVTSFGKSCGQASEPAVYSRVSEFVPWIEETIW